MSTPTANTDTTTATTAHAYSAYWVDENGDHQETDGWWSWLESHATNAELRAISHYYADAHCEGLAVAQYAITVPAGLTLGGTDGPGSLTAYLDDLEWEHDWEHPAVTVVRENAANRKRRAANAARRALIAARAS